MKTCSYRGCQGHAPRNSELCPDHRQRAASLALARINARDIPSGAGLGAASLLAMDMGARAPRSNEGVAVKADDPWAATDELWGKMDKDLLMGAMFAAFGSFTNKDKGRPKESLKDIRSYWDHPTQKDSSWDHLATGMLSAWAAKKAFSMPRKNKKKKDGDGAD